MSLKVDDTVRVIGCPDGLDLETADVFKRCEGQVYRIAGFERDLAELHVGAMFDEPDYLRSIWIEPRFLAAVDD